MNRTHVIEILLTRAVEMPNNADNIANEGKRRKRTNVNMNCSFIVSLE